MMEISVILCIYDFYLGTVRYYVYIYIRNRNQTGTGTKKNIKTGTILIISIIILPENQEIKL